VTGDPEDMNIISQHFKYVGDFSQIAEIKDFPLISIH
jgi:hypothetical protein